MATFEYHALTSSDRLMKGTLEAGSHGQAQEMLGEMNLTVNSITQAKPREGKGTIGRNEFILFNQQMHVGSEIDPGKAVGSFRQNESSTASGGDVVDRFLERCTLVALCIIIHKTIV